jgi:hypothetical protein
MVSLATGLVMMALMYGPLSVPMDVLAPWLASATSVFSPQSSVLSRRSSVFGQGQSPQDWPAHKTED